MHLFRLCYKGDFGLCTLSSCTYLVNATSMQLQKILIHPLMKSHPLSTTQRGCVKGEGWKGCCLFAISVRWCSKLDLKHCLLVECYLDSRLQCGTILSDQKRGLAPSKLQQLPKYYTAYCAWQIASSQSATETVKLDH